MEIWKNSVIVESKEIVYLPIVFISICNLWLHSPSNDYELYKAFLMAKKIWVIIYDTGQDVFPLLKYSHSKNSYWVCGKSPDMYLKAKTEGYVLGLYTLGIFFDLLYLSFALETSVLIHLTVVIHLTVLQGYVHTDWSVLQDSQVSSAVGFIITIFILF